MIQDDSSRERQSDVCLGDAFLTDGSDSFPSTGVGPEATLSR
jgi:hypothetical protein